MIRVAILGAGIGAEHLAGYRALPDRFEVVAICDRDAARAADLAAGGLRIETEIDTVLRDPNVDLIDICLPPHLHASVAIAAMEAGKDVICEKPMACSLSEADAMRSVAEATGRRLHPVFQYRYGPALAALDALVAGDLTGPPVVASLETHWNRDAAYYAVPWRGTWQGERGGAVLGHAIHAHDLLCRYFGSVDAVQAQLGTRVNPIETEDCAAISLRFIDGSLATSSVTLGSARDETRLRFVFRDLTATSGSVPYAPAAGAWRFEARDPSCQGQIDAVVAEHQGAAPGFVGYLKAVADGTAAVGFEDGYASIALVTAIYAAARSGETVHLPLPETHPLRVGWQPEET